MAKQLYIDIETYSSVDIMSSGAYKYCESIDFEILMAAYSIDRGPVKIIDLAQGETWPEEFIKAYYDPKCEKHAHNAAFERTAFKAVGMETPIEQWYCTAVKAAYCGLPISLAMVSEALDLGENGKLSTGKALIRYFCVPIKPTKTNGMRVRNFWYHDLEKWEEFKKYCIWDVVAEIEIDKRLDVYDIPEFERANYILDQHINDRGLLVDIRMAKRAKALDDKHSEEIAKKMIALTGLENPNSPKQLKEWLNEQGGKEVTTLGKEALQILIDEAESDIVKEVLTLRQIGSKTSTKKYVSMMSCAGDDNRVRGLFQFYGATRTGRWAGRLVQLQNLPRNYIDEIESVRELILTAPYKTIIEQHENLSDVLSQLIRTAFIASPGKTFGVADFSAIEARVLSWLANEQWRIDVFKTHGKIYEASASQMFNVPIDEVTKGSDLRAKGKNAELGLGYQGGVNALKKMGGEKMGLSETEMSNIVKLWRKANPNIVNCWGEIGKAAIMSTKTQKKIVLPQFRNLIFEHDGANLLITLPSGRILCYQQATVTTNRFGSQAVKYKNLDQTTKKWWWSDSYGGKFIENIVQAISRDLLAYSLMELHKAGFDITMHVHDEIIAEIDKINADAELEKMCAIMGQEVPWAKGLPLEADGYHTEFYKKD